MQALHLLCGAALPRHANLRASLPCLLCAAVGTIFGIYKAKDPQAELAGNSTLEDVLRVRQRNRLAAPLNFALRIPARRTAAAGAPPVCMLPICSASGASSSCALVVLR